MEEKKSKFKDFLKRLAGNIPEIASDITEVALSPNPIGAGLLKIKERLMEKKETDERYRLALAEFEKNERDWQKEVFALEMEDKKDARLTYREKNEMADQIAKQVMRWNLIIAMALVIANIGVSIYIAQPAIIALASNVIGILLAQVIRERGTLMDFFFGSSLGSKTKESKQA